MADCGELSVFSLILSFIVIVLLGLFLGLNLLLEVGMRRFRTSLWKKSVLGKNLQENNWR